ncbi:MAG: cation:proton antiporter [Deltaproteobacteria bacterium]|nr:cation:proton antiporter [Deltaproteobacteria bacterium]
MTFSRVLVELVVVLGTAAVITVAFQALRLPVVLGYVLAGLLIGPHVPVPLVASPGLVHVLSELGVILLMFTVGTELRLSTIARVGVPAAMTALFEVALVILVGMLVARALGFAPVEALFAGACLGISSTMLVAKAFEEHGWKGGFTEIVFAILVFEDLIAIVLLAILTGVATGAGLDGPELVRMVGRLGGFLVALLVGGLIVVPRVLRFVAARARTETLLIVSLAVCFGASAVADHAGYSVALGAFIAGVLVAESGHGHAVFELVKPFRDVFAMVFFVSVGMSIQPAELYAELPAILVFTLVVLLVKPLGVAIGGFFAGNGVRPAVRAGISLSQIGELSFVIAGIGATSGVARPSLLAIAVGVSCVTTLTSGVLIARSDAAAGAVARWLPGRVTRFESFYAAWLGRLRTRPVTPWRQLRRPAVVLVLDAGLLVAIVIAAATAAPLGAAAIGLVGAPARMAIVGGAAVIATPFVVSLVRRVAVIARILALEVIPARVDPALPDAAGSVSLDLGRAPRRSLTVMLQLGLGLVVAVPIVAATQPFVPGGPLVIMVVVLGLVIVVRRALRDFDGHVRAGSEMILELMRQPSEAAHEPASLAAVEAVLPGFGGLASVTIGPASSAVGRSLAELDLRARTGATVLAIARGQGAGMATPAPTEPLAAGDVLAMAGSDEAIAAARAIFDVHA